MATTTPTPQPSQATVTLTIDDKQVQVAKGTSIIEALDKQCCNSKSQVPRFCYHPGLSVAGVCRFCMVKVEGMPKLQIACNTQCSEGMKVYTQTPEVKEAHKWALEFHLINHPLDCPICDQAGECELQNYYMKVGRYTAQMEEQKQLKPKALDVGDTLVLDTERCILCSRCVRFEDEVTKTGSLGIFNRGDHAIIGVVPGRRIEHNYSYNLADICPVGAFTAKDFRFKCRVWFLKESPSVCPGCSAGCNVDVFQNKLDKTYHRLKPVENEQVNGHWMCDYGRTMYKHLNVDERLTQPMVAGLKVDWDHAISALRRVCSLATEENSDGVRCADLNQPVELIVSPQYTNEELRAVVSFLSSKFKHIKAYTWYAANHDPHQFDGILMRGDHNPNSAGWKMVCDEFGLKPVELKGDVSAFAETKTGGLRLILAPEVTDSHGSDFAHHVTQLCDHVGPVVYLGSHAALEADGKVDVRLPVAVFAEKTGTFVNFNNVAQTLRANPTPAVKGIMPVDEFFHHI